MTPINIFSQAVVQIEGFAGGLCIALGAFAVVMAAQSTAQSLTTQSLTVHQADDRPLAVIVAD